ncbi:MAG: hypothetical protein R2706_16190 [Acidimicrobiales bacterium]
MPKNNANPTLPGMALRAATGTIEAWWSPAPVPDVVVLDASAGRIR